MNIVPASRVGAAMSQEIESEEGGLEDIVWVRLSLRGAPARPVPVPRDKLANLLALAACEPSPPSLTGVGEPRRPGRAPATPSR